MRACRLLGLWLALVLAASLAAAEQRRGELGSADPQLAQAALWYYVAQGATAVPVLRSVLQGDDPLARQYAAAALARLGQPGAEEALLQTLLATGDELLAQFCGEALAARGRAVVPLLRHALALDTPSEFATTADLAVEQEQAILGRSQAFLAVYSLPPELALPLCADYLARPEGNQAGAAQVLLIDYRERGVGLWRRSFLRETGLPTVEAANRAFEAGEEAWDVFATRWQVRPRFHPSGLEIALVTEPGAGLVRRLGLAALSSPVATERFWGYSQLALGAGMGGTELPFPLRAALRDPCWQIPFLLLGGGEACPPEADEAEALLPELRLLAKHPCKPLRCAAVEALAGCGDPLALEALETMLREGTTAERAAAAEIIAQSDTGFGAPQRLRLLQPLLGLGIGNEAVDVCSALRVMPPEAWSAIAEGLRSGETAVRAETARVLGALGAPAAAGALAAALDDTAPEVREAALVSLAGLLHERAAPYLERLLGRGEHGAAYRAACEARSWPLVARIIRSHPEVLLPPATADERAAAAEAIPVWEQRRDAEGNVQARVLPGLVAAAWQLFRDASQPERLRLAAAEALLRAQMPPATVPPPPPGFGPPPRRGGSAAVPPLPAELWPVLGFALEHLPYGLEAPSRGSGNIVAAAARVRDPRAVPTLSAALRTALHREPAPGAGEYGAPGAGGCLAPALAAALGSLGPAGREAFWTLLHECEPATQVRLLAGPGWGVRPADWLPEGKLAEACLRLLEDPTLTAPELGALSGVLPADPQVTAAARRRLWEAYRAAPQSGAAARRTYLSALGRLRDPDLIAEARRLLRSRSDSDMRLWALRRLHRAADAPSRALVLQAASSDFESCWVRYQALRTIETYDAALARRIAERFTHDRRYTMRNLGRMVLAGEEQGYL